MSTDALHSTRPVEYPVGPPEEAQGMFDVLTYQKGASVLRMLERYLGRRAASARASVCYLSDHRSATPRRPTCGRPSRTPAASRCATSWTAGSSKAGSRSSPSKTTTPTRRPRRTVTPHPRALLVQRPPTGHERHRDAAGACRSSPGGADAGHARNDGVARWRSRPASPFRRRPRRPGDRRTRADRASSGCATAKPIWGRWPENLGALGPLERFNLLGDAWASVVAGADDITSLLGPGRSARRRGTPPRCGWRSPGRCRFSTASSTTTTGLRSRSTPRRLLRPVFDRLGWDARPDDGERTATLRALVLATLGHGGPRRRRRSKRPRRRHDMRCRAVPLSIPTSSEPSSHVVAAQGGHGATTTRSSSVTAIPTLPRRSPGTCTALSGVPPSPSWRHAPSSWP